MCSRRGHVTPAARVEKLRPSDAGLGVEIPGGRRFVRCTRCDVWIEIEDPRPPADSEFLPPLDAMPLPRRGEDLKEAIVLRLIAIDRGIHSVIFGLLAIVLLVIELDFGSLTSQARTLLRALSATIADTGQGSGQTFLTRSVQKVANLQQDAVKILLATAIIYCVLEGVEAVGLWHEKRWAEYLTAVATAGFLPFEIHELLVRVTVVRIGALVINVAVLVYLLWKKKLFGIGGGAKALAHETIDRQAVFGPPAPLTEPAAPANS